MYKYNGEKCVLGTNNFLLGTESSTDDGRTWDSGWNHRRIEEWVSAKAPCTDIEFPFETKRELT